MKTLSNLAAALAVTGILTAAGAAQAIQNQTVCVDGASGGCAGTNWNFNVSYPSGAANNFEIVLPGDQSGVATGIYNSFPNGGSSAIYNPGNNTTTLVFQGDDLPASGPYGPGGSAAPHFGFSGVVPGVSGGGNKIIEAVPPLLMYWTFGASTVNTVPGVGIVFTSNGDGPLGYAVFHVTSALPGGGGGGLGGSQGPSGGSVTNWYEFAYRGSFSASLTGSDGGVAVSQVGYLTTTSEIPLDALNANTDGTGLPFNAFLPAGVADGTTIASGQSLNLDIPEPASAMLVLTGIGGLAARRRRT